MSTPVQQLFDLQSDIQHDIVPQGVVPEHQADRQFVRDVTGK